MVVCICGTCTSIWKGKTSDSLLTTPGNTDENTTGQKGSKYNCTDILGKNWGLFSVVQQTQLDLNIDSEWRFHNEFNSHYIYQVLWLYYVLNIMYKCKSTFIHDDSVSRFSGEILVCKN